MARKVLKGQKVILASKAPRVLPVQMAPREKPDHRERRARLASRAPKGRQDRMALKDLPVRTEDIISPR